MKKKPQYLDNGKALKRHDPISVYNGSATLGSVDISSIFEDSLYHFESADNKQLFDQNPGKYTPKYGGFCSIAICEGNLVPANPHSALIQDGDLHVFYKDDDEDTQDEWKENPVIFKGKADSEWMKLI